MAEELLFTKIIDKSALYQGISIPVACQGALCRKMGISLNKGEQKRVQVEMSGYVFDDAVLKNQSFDEEKYPNRTDIMQIRYHTQSLLAKKIREIFIGTDALVRNYLESHKRNKKQIIIPEDNREYIVLYVSEDRIRFDCIPRNPLKNSQLKTDFGEEAPQRRETISLGFKRNANVIVKAKERAKGICQLCGKSAPFNDKQGGPYLEVHHVIWLSRGGSDKLSNTVALCPNCHSKMHIVDDEQDIEILLEKAKTEQDVV